MDFKDTHTEFGPRPRTIIPSQGTLFTNISTHSSQILSRWFTFFSAWFWEVGGKQRENIQGPPGSKTCSGSNKDPGGATTLPAIAPCHLHNYKNWHYAFI